MRSTRILLTLALVSFSSLLSANSFEEELADLDERQKEIKGNASEIIGDIGDYKEEVSDDAYSLAKKTADEALKQTRSALKETKTINGYDISKASSSGQKDSNVKEVNEDGQWVNILVSRSLGENDLKTIISQSASYDVPVRIVFSGIPEDETINDSLKTFATWASEIDEKPETVIDPVAFKDHGNGAVPRMIWMDSGEAVASVDGITDPSWLKRQIDQGETGDLGKRGPTATISEPNLIDLIKKRLAKIDLMEKKQETIDTYWERFSFLYISPAQNDDVRYIDPTVVVQKPLKTNTGEIVVPAGSEFNPLSMRPFTRRLVVFNPNREAEVEWVNDLEKAQGLKDIYIATELREKDGWDQLESIQDQLDAPLYLLQKDVWQRFDINRTPTLVTSEGLHFKIKETALGQYRSDQKEP